MDPRLRRVYSRCVVEVERGLLPDLVNDRYDYLIIDLASITYAVRDPRAFLINIRLALDYDYLRPRVIFTIDYSRPEHKAVAETRIKWLRDLGLEYVLADNEPAEMRAAKECLAKPRCIVLSRDYDPLTIVDEILQPLKVSERAWVNRRVRVDRECLLKYLGDKA